MKKTLERILYSFGVSCANPWSPEFKFIGDKIPREFSGREMCDLGCGDGANTGRLAKIFGAKSVMGYDASKSLVRIARWRGLDAHVMDLEAEVPCGELALVWGVLHHIKDRKGFLERVRDNFNLVFIREELTRKKIFELGELMTLQELEKLYSSVFGDVKYLEMPGRALYMMWRKRKI